MRTNFIHLRIYRKRDHRYWTLYLKINSDTLAELDRIIFAYREGLRVAGAEVTDLENIYFDYPQGTTPAEDYHYLDDPETFASMYKFLQMRDRRLKTESYTTEDTKDFQDGTDK